MRWENTLKGFDRVLWEAMRAELLEGRVRKPKEFVEGVRDAVVCHCDQIPMWLRLGSARQLFAASELRKGVKRKLHEEKRRGEVGVSGKEQGGQVLRCDAEDGMTQMRQSADGAADRFRVTLETSQMVFNQFKAGGEAPEVRHGKPVLVVPGCHARLTIFRSRGLGGGLRGSGQVGSGW